METLQISKDNAVKAYQEANEKEKTLLSNLFGKKVFQTNVMDRIKSYEDACEDQGIKPLKLSDFDFLPEIDREYHFEDHKRAIITRALNEGWVADHSDTDQVKYTVWYKSVGSGRGFAFDGCGAYYAYSFVGARHEFKSRELAEYFASQFISTINTCFTIQQS